MSSLIEYKRKTLNYLSWLYLQYVLITTMYVMTPGEKIVFNMFVLIVLITGIYSTCMFLPEQLHRISYWIHQNFLND